MGFPGGSDSKETACHAGNLGSIPGLGFGESLSFKTIFDISLSLTLHFSYVTKTGPFYLPDTSQIPQSSSISTSTSLLSLPLSHLDPWDSFLTDLPAAAAAKLLQSCPTLCDPIDGSPPGSPVPEILQARTLEWVAISFSNTWKWKVNSLSRVQLLATSWTTAYQAPPSMGFSRQEYWSGVPLPYLPIYS